jgi:hypothetical protein
MGALPAPHMAHSAGVFRRLFQDFLAGERSERGGAQMREVLASHIRDEDGTFIRVRAGDGGADIYLRDGGMMANHVEGRAAWDLLVHGARAANWVIIAVGCPTCLTRPGQMEELPDALREAVVVIETGSDLQAVIESR